MNDPTVARRRRNHGDGLRALAVVLLVASLVIQCVVLYAPQGVGESPFPHADKVVHLLVFAVPAVLAVLAGFRPVVVLAVLGTHAALSEVVQGVVLPDRSGDPLDVAADLVGVLLGLGVSALLARRRRPPVGPRASGAGPSRW